MRWLSVLFCLIVAACSGTAGGAVDPEDTRAPFVPIVPVEEPELSGTASYSGAIGLTFFAPLSGDLVDLDGALSLQVDFDNMDAAVTGVASGFAGDNGAFDGNLLVNTGALDDSTGGLDFVTNINGSLSRDTASYLVLGQMRGEVLGLGETAASGNIAGEVLERGFSASLSGDFQTARAP